MKKFHLDFKKNCRTTIEVDTKERKKKERKSILHLPRRSRYKNIASLNKVAVCTFCAIFLVICCQNHLQIESQKKHWMKKQVQKSLKLIKR